MDNELSVVLSIWTTHNLEPMPTRKPPQERRAEILAATQRLVAQRGFASVTLRDVAAEVGVVHGLLRHYFPTREALVAAAFEAAVTDEMDSSAAVAGAPDVVAALAGWLELLPREHYMVWIDAWSEAPRNPELAAALLRHTDACTGHLTAIIRRAVDAGFGASDDPAGDARLLTAVSDGFAVQVFAVGDVSMRTAQAAIDTAAESRLGLAPGSLDIARRSSLLSPPS